MTSAAVIAQVAQTRALMRAAARAADTLEAVTDEALIALNKWGHDGALSPHR